MIIGACGYGATGSSVLTDLLKEYDDIQVIDDFEFWIGYRVDGIEDLEFHLMKQYSKGESCDVAIKRFLRRSRSYMLPFINKPCNGKKFYKYSQEFINEITQFTFKGSYTADICTGYLISDFFAFALKKIIIPKVVEKITKKRSYMWPCGKKYYSIEPENFYRAANNYTSKIIKEMGVDITKPICFDQPFSGNSPENSMKYFEDAYAVVIDKDPRDLYLAGKFTKDPNFKFSPIDDVEKFIIYYKNMRKHEIANDKILRIKFEDLIYNYDTSIDKIERFLKLGVNKRKGKFFNPNKSINNTQLIRLHPEEKENIRKIEEKLPEYLFPFEKYSKIAINGRPFDGAARKSFSQ